MKTILEKFLVKYNKQLTSNGFNFVAKTNDNEDEYRYYLSEEESVEMEVYFREVKGVPFLDLYADYQDYENDRTKKKLIKVYDLLNSFIKEEVPGRETGIFLMEEHLFEFDDDKFKQSFNPVEVLELDFVFPRVYVDDADEMSVMLLTNDNYCIQMDRAVKDMLKELESKAQQEKLYYTFIDTRCEIVVDYFGKTLMHIFVVKHVGDGILEVRYRNHSRKAMLENYKVDADSFFKSVERVVSIYEKEQELESLVANDGYVLFEKVRLKFRKAGKKMRQKEGEALVEFFKNVGFDDRKEMEIYVEFNFKDGAPIAIVRYFNQEIILNLLN